MRKMLPEWKAGMTPHQFQNLRESAGLTRQQAADYLGVTLRTIYRYEGGEHAINPQAAKLMEML